jgi:hypothetical protein
MFHDVTFEELKVVQIDNRDKPEEKLE